MTTAGETKAILTSCLVAAALALLAASPALAETAPRIRGVVTAVDKGSITVKERNATMITLKTGADTMYADVVSSSLAEIGINDFVGTAVKGPQNGMVAVELVVIPEGMQAGRIALYGWDPLPDPTATRLTDTNMTNGIVSAKEGDAHGLILTIAYDDGTKSFRISVPPTAPVTRFELAARSSATMGSPVFIKTDPGDRAALIAVGKGITPPM